MSQPNTRAEGTPARSGARGNIASKSREAAERVETSVTEGAERVRSQADDAKERAAERLRRVASQLDHVGEGLRADDAAVAKLAERASRGIERVADYVSSTDGPGIIRDTEQLARRRPALFFGGAFLLGLAAGRFLRSSRPDSDAGGPQRPGQRPGYDYGNYGNRGPEQRYGAEQRARGMSERASSSPSQLEAERRRTSASQERYQHNYDAAFGRDSSAEQASVTPGGSGTSVPGSSGPTGPERNVTGPTIPTKGSES